MTKVSVNAPKTPVTEGSSGIAAATLPNVCKMPGPPAPFVPTPLPNIGKSGTSPKGYSKTVTIEGKKVGIRGATFGSMGDVASKGTGGGIVSSNVEGPTSFVGPGSMDTKIEGKNVQLLGDPMLNNCGPSGSPANAATMMGVIQATGFVTAVPGEDGCQICHKPHSALEETPQTKTDATNLVSKLDEVVKAKKKHLATMVGVIKCKWCEQNFTDHSGVTLREFNEVAAKLEWHAPEGSLSLGELDLEDKAFNATLESVRSRLVTLIGEDNVKEPWREGSQRSLESMNSMESMKKGEIPEALPAAYPPGACAAQKALVFARGKEAFPGALTEQYYHRKGKPTSATIRYLDAVSGEVTTRVFDHGTTVPPCRTCELIIPLMLCPVADKEEPCQH
ncbi:MAG TPA: PAAR-like domain-containing protein [Myxococcaceae bacterium]|jgi:hypothetical protein